MHVVSHAPHREKSAVRGLWIVKSAVQGLWIVKYHKCNVLLSRALRREKVCCAGPMDCEVCCAGPMDCQVPQMQCALVTCITQGKSLLCGAYGL